MTKFTARPLPSCTPISRMELYEEVTGRHSSEGLHNVWIVPGHVFVSLNDGNKLLTFDCKPVSYQHHLGTSTLDFPVLQPAVISILSSPYLPNLTFIVQRNGHVHCWQFDDSFRWSSVLEFDLCERESRDAEIISVCLHPKLNAFFWCEQRCSDNGSLQHTVYQGLLPDSIEKLKKRKKKKGTKGLSCVVENCLASDVLSLGDGLVIVPRHQADHARVSIFWKLSVLEMVSVTAIIGTTVRELHDMRSPVSFPTVLTSCLSDLAQAGPSEGDLGVKKDSVTGDVVLLQSDGMAQIFQVKNDEGKSSLTTELVKITDGEQLPTDSTAGDSWSVHRGILALTTRSNSVRLYSLPGGQFLHEVEAEGGHTIRGLAQVRSAAVVVALITDSGVSLVQGGKVLSSPNPQNGLPQDKQFQTDALQVALLNQERMKSPSKSVSDQLESLHIKWCDLQTRQPRSQLSDTVDSYLAEFWRLEEIAQGLGKSQAALSPPPLDTHEMVREAISRGHSMVSEAGIAELLWLSKKYPVELLEALTEDLNIGQENLGPEDQPLWQTKLGLGPASHTTSPITYELICRLLYQEKPQSLVPFVRNAQRVSEQAVGVSAFVRRKHTLQYYVRAMECLPEPSVSKNPQQAAKAKAQIIVLGETEHGHELALRFLLQHGHWSEAIHLLQTLDPKSQQRCPLFFLLLQHLVQNQVLSDYAADVFSLLPSWKSFLAAVKVIGDSADPQFGPLTTSTPSLFSSGPPDVPLSAVRPHLVALLSQCDKSTQADR